MTTPIVRRRAGVGWVAALGLIALAAGCAASTPGTPTDAGPGTTSPTGRSAVAVSGELPPDVDLSGATVTVTWIAGSVPPPYHYQWSMTTTGTTGTLTFTEGYSSGGPTWSADFTATQPAVDDFHRAIAEAAVTDAAGADTQVGGATGSWQVVTADGQTYAGTVGRTRGTGSEFAKLTDAAKALVPADVWASVEAKYQAYAQSALDGPTTTG